MRSRGDVRTALAHWRRSLARAQFVGRRDELETLRGFIDAAPGAPCLVYVHGIAGAGKSSLLWEVAGGCVAAGNACAYVDVRHLEPVPSMLEQALDEARAAAATGAGAGRRDVLLLDHWEATPSLDAWLRDVYLARLPAEVLVIVASRLRPRAAWRADPAWGSAIRLLELSNLDEDACAAYLERRGLDAAGAARIFRFTHGHALAVALVADVLAQRPDTTLAPRAPQDVVASLLELLLDDAPTTQHREALDACAVVRSMNESLLAAMLAVADARELFQWLERLSFLAVTAGGLVIHDLVRELVLQDLEWRNPARARLLARRASAHYLAELPGLPPREQLRITADVLSLHQRNPLVRQAFDWSAGAELLPVP